MKKVFVGIMAVTFIMACNEPAPKKTEKSETTTSKEEKPDLTGYGITSGENPSGLTTGVQAPDVALTFQNGDQKTLRELYSEQPLVVFFYRGYWCPYCSKYLSEIATQAKKLEAAGARLIAITPETYTNVDKAKDASKATFDIVSDTTGEVMKAFKVEFDVTEDYQEKIKNGLNISLALDNASGDAILPIPATYVIDKTGKIVYSFNNPDYRLRAPIDEILKHIPSK